MQEKTMIRNMTEGPVAHQLITFALPFLLANCLQTFYTMVDTFVIGRFAGKVGLAAVSNCGELVTFYSMIGMGLASAGQIIIAQFVGKNDHDAVRKTIGTFFSFLMIVAVCLSVVCIALVDWQLDLINLPEESLSAGRSYMLVSAAGFIFVFGYNAVSSVLRGMGDSKRPLVFVAIASVMNLLLDLLFVVVFHWDAFGAALATVLGQAFSVVASVIYLYHRRESFGFDFKPSSFRIDRQYLSMILRLGVPMAAQFAAVLLSVLFVSSRINLFGVSAAAANGVAAKLENIVRIVTNSIGTAGSAMIAQNIAAKKTKRVSQILGWVLLIGGIWSLLCALTIGLFPQKIFAIFNTDSEVLAYASQYAPAGALGYMSNGLRGAANCLINGIGFASLALVSGLIDGVFARIGFSLLFGYALHMGLFGFWLGSAMAGYVPVVIGLVYYLSGRWKTRKLITQQDE
jgi:putative MATE family efflux protein